VGIVYEIGERASKEIEVYGNELKVGDRVTWAPCAPCGKCKYCKLLPLRQGARYCPNTISIGKCTEPPYFIMCGFCEYSFLPSKAWVFKLPNEMSDEEAVLIEPLACVLSGIEKAMTPEPYLKQGFGIGDNIVIQGAGVMGILAATIVKALGAKIIIMIGAPEWRLKLAEEFGVTHVINIDIIKKPQDRIENVMKITKGWGADLVIECTGNPLAIPEGIEMVRRGGVYLQIGVFRGKTEISIDPYKLCYRELRWISQWGNSPLDFERGYHFMLTFKNNFPFKKLITHRFKLEEVGQALEISEKLECLKAVILP
ncbi:MAG: zinc-binding dehydrogenase, partial [Candidatus Micrarchaeia archaeon]